MSIHSDDGYDDGRKGLPQNPPNPMKSLPNWKGQRETSNLPEIEYIQGWIDGCLARQEAEKEAREESI